MGKVERQVTGILSMSLAPTKQQSHKWGEQGRRESESIPLFPFSHFLFHLNPISQPPGFLLERLPTSESLKRHPLGLPHPKQDLSRRCLGCLESSPHLCAKPREKGEAPKDLPA